ncbi:TolB family protein [Colwelliaceae bacterium 6471]
MKRFYTFIAMFSALTMNSQTYAQDDFPVLEGPYMGQTPPGVVAEPFASGIISKEGWELEGVFAPGMKEFYFTLDRGSKETGRRHTVVGFRQENSIWKKFTEFRRTGEVTFSPDGKRMHMAKGYKDRTENGWSERKSLGPMFDRKDWGIMRLSASAKGTYVFDDYKSNDEIRISRVIDGERQAPEKLGPEINTGKWTAHPFIAPDESYLIWDSEREGGFGDSDLYISFKQKDGSWGSAINMGPEVNSDKWDAYASVTPDGKYILFNRRIDDGTDNEKMNVDIYWVDAQIIAMLRTKSENKNKDSLASNKE